MARGDGRGIAIWAQFGWLRAPLVVVGSLGVAREGISGMEKRRNSGLIGRARRGLQVGVPAVGLAVAMVGVAPVDQAFAQEDIGASIAATVANAVSRVATNSGSTGGSIVTGSVSTEHNALDFGDDEGTSISDASGGNYNTALPNG